jgi:lipoate-protein ligase A
MSIVKLLYFESDLHDPCVNLAIEEKLLHSVKEGEQILYLWQNDNTLVIGKHQNAHAECSPTFDGTIVRRLSGGGAVFHDMGNLNFTFVSPRQDYDVHRNMEIILRAVRKLGINAEFSGRNDLTVDERKFSGNAFCLTKDSAYHHGTILVNADMSKLASALNVSREKLESKGVKSVRARVINLQELNPKLTVSQIKECLFQSFCEEYKQDTVQKIEIDLSEPEWQEKINKYRSRDWVWGQNPNFSNNVRARFEWGEVEVNYEVKSEQIVDFAIYTDAVILDWIDEVKKILTGAYLHDLKQQISSHSGSTKDILELVAL